MYLSGCQPAITSYSTVDPATPVSVHEDPDTDTTWQANHLTREDCEARETLRITWHQCLVSMHSHRVSDMHKYALWASSSPIATQIDNNSIYLETMLHKTNKPTRLPLLITRLLRQGCSIDLSCSLPKIASVFVAPATCMASATYS
jgi:hypothetical protein